MAFFLLIALCVVQALSWRNLYKVYTFYLSAIQNFDNWTIVRLKNTGVKVEQYQQTDKYELLVMWKGN